MACSFETGQAKTEWNLVSSVKLISTYFFVISNEEWNVNTGTDPLTGTDVNWSFTKGSLTYRQLLLLTPFSFLGLHDARHLDHGWHGLGSHSDTGDNIETDAC